MATLNILPAGIDGVTVELQPRFGDHEGAVWHMLPGGVGNPEGFGEKLLDIYASSAKGKGTMRGGHYHLELDELFFTLSGCALWLLSDFRETSPTFQKTVGIILGIDTLSTPYDLPTYVVADGSLPRLRIPAGVYHAIIPLTDERVTAVGVGSTSYNKNDYRYPELQDIPGAKEILQRTGITSE